MKILYVDMDGVLAIWPEFFTVEEISCKGFHENQPPQMNLIEALEKLSKKVEIIVLSVAGTSKYAASDKNSWLDMYAKFIKKRILITDGRTKGNFVNGDNVYLLDDYTKNLDEWEESGGIGIKFYNTRNNNNGTWQGYVVTSEQNSESLYKCLCAYLGV